MFRTPILALCLLVLPSIGSAAEQPPVAAAATAPANALPPMYFLSTIAKDDVLAGLKSNPGLAALDSELVGSPLMLIVTHTVRPATGSQTAGFVTAILSGSTLGLIPVVSRETLVVRYEVKLNGKDIASYSFEYTGTRAINIWANPGDGYEGIGKTGMDWVKSTAPEAAAKLMQDPAIQRARAEIQFYFPPGSSGA